MIGRLVHVSTSDGVCRVETKQGVVRFTAPGCIVMKPYLDHHIEFAKDSNGKLSWWKVIKVVAR